MNRAQRCLVVLSSTLLFVACVLLALQGDTQVAAALHPVILYAPVGTPKPSATSTLPSPTATAPQPTATATATSICDPSWKVVHSPNASSGYSILNGVSVLSADDVWAVGAYGGSNYGTLIEHWNGNHWEIVPSPDNGFTPVLNAVDAVSANDIWAVGYYGPGYYGGRALAMHWNGFDWSMSPVPHPGVSSPDDPPTSLLYGLAAVSANDVWAVGTQSCGICNLTAWILHWDGSSWSIVPNPNVNMPSDLHSINALSSDDIWAVGSQYEGTLVEHWDGTSWSVVDSPSPGVYPDLLGIAALSPTDIWAVGYIGYYYVDQTLVEHWDGTSWSIVPSPNFGPGSNRLLGVTAVAPDQMWAVGTYETGTVKQTLIERWDGNSWSVFPSPNRGQHDNYLRAVAALPTGDVWGVGNYLNEDDGVDETLVLRYMGFFSDVPIGSPYYQFVQCLACQGIISGYSDGTFHLNHNITRGEIAKVVSNGAGLTDDVAGRWTYADVPNTNPFWLWIERLALHEVVNGYQCGGPGEPCDDQQRPYFRWTGDTTRAQLAKIASNAAGYNNVPATQTFTDVPPTHPLYLWVERLAERSVIGGYPCGGAGEPCDNQQRPYFRPGTTVTRGQASKVVTNTFFPDCQASKKGR